MPSDLRHNVPLKVLELNSQQHLRDPLQEAALGLSVSLKRKTNSVMPPPPGKRRSRRSPRGASCLVSLWAEDGAVTFLFPFNRSGSGEAAALLRRQKTATGSQQHGDKKCFGSLKKTPFLFEFNFTSTKSPPECVITGECDVTFFTITINSRQIKKSCKNK